MTGKIMGGIGLVLAMYGTLMLARSTPNGYGLPFWGDRCSVGVHVMGFHRMIIFVVRQVHFYSKLSP